MLGSLGGWMSVVEVTLLFLSTSYAEISISGVFSAAAQHAGDDPEWSQARTPRTRPRSVPPAPHRPRAGGAG